MSEGKARTKDHTRRNIAINGLQAVIDWLERLDTITAGDRYAVEHIEEALAMLRELNR